MTIATGATAPAIALPDAAEDAPHDLSEALKSGPAIVGIYKSSCEASKTMFRMLEQIRQKYPDDRLAVWGVAQDSPNVTRSFIRRIGLSFPILIEGDEYPISKEYDIEATPTVFLIDQSGTIIWQGMGFQNAAIEELSGKVAEILGVEPVDIFDGVEDIPGWVPG
ncbi:MAG: TlpA disulfide reductase family protein [Thermomicrobiaceae bacterium]